MSLPSSHLIVAIDGPAGAGKSTVAALVSQALGLPMLDTGAMYRAVAWLAREQGVASSEADVLATLARENPIRVHPHVTICGEDVHEMIRDLAIGQLASEISIHSGVRQALVAQQQAILQTGSYVLEGRDTTTVVAPAAQVKVFLTASIEERARRRWLQLRVVQPQLRLQEVVRDVVSRDHRDYTRADSPLQLAEDAVIIESFGITAEEVCDRIVALVPRASD